MKSQADEGAVDISEEGGGGGGDGGGDGAGGGRHPRVAAPLPPSATLALAASAVRMLCGCDAGDEAALFRRARQMLVARWAVDAPMGTDDVVRRVVAHDARRAARRSCRAWRGVVASRRAAIGGLSNAVRVWQSRAVGAAAMAWKAVCRAERAEDETRMEHAAQWHAAALVSAWASHARARRRHRAEMVDAMNNIQKIKKK